MRKRVVHFGIGARSANNSVVEYEISNLTTGVRFPLGAMRFGIFPLTKRPWWTEGFQPKLPALLDRPVVGLFCPFSAMDSASPF